MIFFAPKVPNPHETIGRYSELTGTEEVRDLQEGMDFRRPEYRREVFLRFYEFHTRYRAHPGCVYFLLPYLREAMDWTEEQALWFGFINGNTQNPITSWLIFRRFDDLDRLAGNMNEFVSWIGKNYNRLAFDSDRRHHKKVFVEATQKYLALTGGRQRAYFGQFIRGTDPYANFRRTWNAVMEKFHGFGRLSTFSYLEYLRILKADLDCPQLFLEDLEGSRSHRNGLAKVLGRDDLDWHESNPTGFTGKYTPQVMKWLRSEGEQLLHEARSRITGKPYDRDVSYFTLESTLCTYKSWHRPNRRYPGVYLDMLHDRIKKAEAAWPEEDFSIFWKARNDRVPGSLLLEHNPKDCGVKPEKQNVYRNTGSVIMMSSVWPCFENDFDRLIWEDDDNASQSTTSK